MAQSRVLGIRDIRGAIGLLLLLAPGCRLLENENDRALRVIDIQVVNREVGLELRNDGRAPVTMGGCGEGIGFEVHEWLDGRWKYAFDRGMICLALLGGTKVTLERGQTVRVSVAFLRAGTFRVRIPYAEDDGDHAAVVSPTFDVR